MIPPNALLARIPGSPPDQYLTNWHTGFGNTHWVATLRIDGTWDVSFFIGSSPLARFPYGIIVDPDH